MSTKKYIKVIDLRKEILKIIYINLKKYNCISIFVIF